jgi:DNA-binding transcriptional ArsR family regulator
MNDPLGSADHLSATLAALADPTRRAILARLALGETAVTELAEPFAMSLPAVSKHLKVLERAGLIVRGREAQWRPCRLQAAPLKDVAEWIEGYRRFWEQSLDRLEDYLQELQANEAQENKENQAAKEKKRGRRKPPRPNPTSKPE